MRNLQTVCVYHYDQKTNIWEGRLLNNCMISGTANAYSLDDTQNRNAFVTVRVMTDAETSVFPEDMIFFSSQLLNKPPEKGGVVVVSVTNNRRGSARVRHTKILCR